MIHCTGTVANVRTSSIINHWRNVLKWRNVGYHFLVNADGSFEQLADERVVTNGVAGYNSNSIHICYKGGVLNGKNEDTRTEAQKKTIEVLISKMLRKYADAEILGHRDFPNVRKDCPCFDAKKEYKNFK